MAVPPGGGEEESDVFGNEDEAAEEIDREDGFGGYLTRHLRRLANPLMRLDEPGGAFGGKAVDGLAERGLVLEKATKLLLDD
jgi:hypothetical protein